MNQIKLPFGLVLSRPKAKTALHPELKTLTQFAFEIDGVDYYEFSNIADMPKDRFRKANELLINCEWSISTEDLKDYSQKIRQANDKANTKAVDKVLDALDYSISLFIDTDVYMRLFSCAFFTLDEDLTDYDYDIGEQKMRAFKKHGIPSFFLKEPISRYLPQINLSKEIIETFSKLTNVKRDYQTWLKSKAMEGIIN